jgi:hypothetical protein
MLMVVKRGQEFVLDSGDVFESNYLINNGWVAYGKVFAGVTQVWRCSPDGATTQLSYWGTSSRPLALSPNGAVMFANSPVLVFSEPWRLYLSQGTFPAWDVLGTHADPALHVFWGTDRWYASLGRSLYQVYTGQPYIAGSCAKTPGKGFQFDVVAAVGQIVITQLSTNAMSWVDCCTNTIADGTGVSVSPPTQTDCTLYRLRVQ